ncbi:hypothetical protein TorRG33x02_070000, partial [Trema orientale]
MHHKQTTDLEISGGRNWLLQRHRLRWRFLAKSLSSDVCYSHCRHVEPLLAVADVLQVVSRLH